MSAMIRSRTPQRTKFVYTRFPMSVSLPASVRCAAPFPLSFLFLASLGLRFVDSLLHLPGVRPDLLLHLFLGAFGRLFDRPLDRRLPDNYQGCLAIIEHLPDLLEVRVGHPAPEVADERARPSTHQAADQDRRRKDHADRRAGSQASPATVLGRLLGLVYDLYLAFFVLGEDGRVVSAYDMLAVELLKLLAIGLGVVHVIVFARVQEHRVVAHGLTLLCAAPVALPPLSLPADPSLVSTSPCNAPFLNYSFTGWRRPMYSRLSNASSPNCMFPLGDFSPSGRARNKNLDLRADRTVCSPALSAGEH